MWHNDDLLLRMAISIDSMEHVINVVVKVHEQTREVEFSRSNTKGRSEAEITSIGEHVWGYG
jgi:hypothetical protein